MRTWLKSVAVDGRSGIVAGPAAPGTVTGEEVDGG